MTFGPPLVAQPNYGKDPSRSRTFTYDALNRIASAQTTGTDCSATLPDGHTKNWGNTYSYDPWSDLVAKIPTKCGAENVSFTMNVKNEPTANSFLVIVGWRHCRDKLGG